MEYYYLTILEILATEVANEVLFPQIEDFIYEEIIFEEKKINVKKKIVIRKNNEQIWNNACKC